MGRSPCHGVMGLKKGPWTPEEDHNLVTYIQNHGHRTWRDLPKLAGLNRCGKSCRLRWTNYLRPGIKRGRFSQEEQQTILNLHAILGNKWSTIASHLPGRTDNEVKNFWNTHLKKKLFQLSYDPMNQPTITHEIFSTLMPYHLIALSNLKQFFDHQPMLDHHDQNLVDASSLLAKLLFLQQFLKPQYSSTDELVNSTRNFMDMNDLNFLCSFPHDQLNNDNLVLSSAQFENTISSSSLEANNNNYLQLFNDSNISFSHIPSLDIQCTYEQPLSKGMVQFIPQSKALCSPNSPWLPSYSSNITIPSPSNLVPLVTYNTNMANDYGDSGIWDDLLLMEDPLFNEIPKF